MASTQISGSTLSLHGAPNKTEKDQSESAMSRTAIILRLNEQVIRDLQQCAQAGKAVQLLGGKTPKIRYGANLLDLNVRQETFRHEVYSADESTDSLGFTAFVSHHAELKLAVEKKPRDDGAGADAALETLKQSLASMAKQKEERKATISGSLMPAAKHSKYLHPSRQPTSLPNRSNSSSSTPRPAAPTSASSDPHAKAREKAMRVALVHLLAIKPLSEDDINRKTHIPKSLLSSFLPKIAEKSGAQWDLSNKYYKELDPWSFKYTSDQRQTAIDNAIRALDRQRTPKDDKSWQTLLPKEERNKGKVLSRLHLTTEKKENLGTPGLAQTPLPTSAAATPKLGTTPRGAATATGRSAAGISIEKRLKEAKKKGAMEKKKLEKEAKEAAAAASDRESKPRATTKKPVPPKKVPAKVKSDEVVHSSDEEEEGEVREEGEIRESAKPAKDSARKEPPKPLARSRPVPERRESSASEVSTAHFKPKPKTSAAERLTAGTTARKDSATPTPRPKVEATRPSQAPSLPKKPESLAPAKASSKAKDTPLQKPAKATSTSQRPQISPRRLTDTKPKVPSPLGTSPPRNASDYAEKPKTAAKPAASATTKSVKASTSTKTPDPLSFFGGVKPIAKTKIVTKKRPLESDTDTPEPARKLVKPSSTSTPAKPTANGTSKLTVNGTTKSSAASAQSARPALNSGTLKRKANDLSSGLHDHGPPASKHRKTDSGSTHSHAPTNSSVASLTTAPTVSPDPTSPARSDYSDDNLVGILEDDYTGPPLTWEQARGAAETFRLKLYPEYLKLYHRLERMPSHEVSKDDRVRLWQLHNRLEAVKHRIEAAAQRGDSVDI